MANFSDYINNNNDTANTEKTKSSKELKQDDLEKLIDKYSKYDSNSLMSEFLKLTLEKKRRGELKKDELQSIKQTIYPYLDNEQKQNLDNLINMVDNVK